MSLVSYIKTLWQDRAVSTPNNYTASGAVTGTVTLLPAPGIVTQAGTNANAFNLNHLEQGVYDAQETANAATAITNIYAQQNLGGF